MHTMELVSPAGNLEKLRYAWEYGADAAYIGLKNFSLRVKADNFFTDEYKTISALKAHYAQQGQPKKLLCALNISFHNDDLKAFLAEADYFKLYPIDAFIIQDIGMVSVLRKHFPHIPLHLSTQANCINYEAVRVYRDLGFKRIVLGREASIADIAEIKAHVPEMELECFVHGAMCIAYSGRCLISAYLTGRSANAGACTHSCRWDYSLLSKNALDCANLGYAYDSNRSFRQAARYYDRACKLGEQKGCVYLGLLYNDGQGVAQDRKRANELFSDACKKNSRGDGCWSIPSIPADTTRPRGCVR